MVYTYVEAMNDNYQPYKIHKIGLLMFGKYARKYSDISGIDIPTDMIEFGTITDNINEFKNMQPNDVLVQTVSSI
jgi:hypothetical protein